MFDKKEQFALSLHLAELNYEPNDTLFYESGVHLFDFESSLSWVWWIAIFI